MTGLVVARASADDLDVVGRLTVAAYVPVYVAPDDDYADHLADAAGRAREAEVVVARRGELGDTDGPVVGAVTFCPPGSSLREIARDDEGELRMLAVDPRARGRGVGQALVEHCLTATRELGLAGVRISTLPGMTGAHRLYERLGFERAPDDDWSPVAHVRLLAYALRWA